MFQAVKKIGFSTLALLAIVLTSFRPLFAETTSRQDLFSYDLTSGHEHLKFRTHADLSNISFTESDSEEFDDSDADDDLSLNHVDFILSAAFPVAAGFHFVRETENPRLFGQVSATPRTNASPIYLKHRQILR